MRSCVFFFTLVFKAKTTSEFSLQIQASMISTSDQVLSNEVLQIIIDNLDITLPTDREALSNCSCANYALNVMCQKWLFLQVDVTVKASKDNTGIFFYEDGTTTARKFLRLLHDSPHLAQYVQAIKVTVDGRFSPERSTIISNDCQLSHNATFSLYTILPNLPNLRKFAIRIESIPPSWSKHETRIQSFLTDILQRLPQVDMQSYYGFPPLVLANCPALKELHIARLYPGPENSAVVGPSAAKARLEFLRIFYMASYHLPGSFFMDPWFAPESGLIDLTGLRSLQIQAPVAAIAGILKLCFGSLESLDFSIQSRVYFGNFSFSYDSKSGPLESLDMPSLLDLSELCDLRSLTTHAIITHRELASFLSSSVQPHGYDTDLRFLSSILGTLPKRRNFPILRITIIIKVYDVPIDLLASIRWSDLIGELLGSDNSVANGVDLELKLEAYREWKRIDELSERLRVIWDRDEYLNMIREKGWIRVFF